MLTNEKVDVPDDVELLRSDTASEIGGQQHESEFGKLRAVRNLFFNL